MIKSVIFDSDGVVVDTTEYDYEAWKKTLLENGVNLSMQEYKGFLGMKGQEVVKKCIVGVSDELAVEIYTQKENYFASLVDKRGVKTIPRVVQFIKKIKRDVKIALATASPSRKIDLVMNKVKLKNFFDAIVTADDVKKGKPNPELFLKAAQKLGIVPAEGIVIEDAPNGVAAAKAGGFRCVAITTTHERKELREADYIINTFDEFKMEWLR